MAKSVKSSKELLNIPAYQVEYEEELNDLKATGIVFTHRKTGAKVSVVSNEDDNKVFCIGFRTPPFDSTGVAHIIEHTVLCGSKNFPAKDPFIELAKGSLNTFLNAMTYPDKTLYPVASCNEKDFQNLMHVYMDAVLYPNIYKKEEIFKQEGWHYEITNKEAPIELNGIVYSEMKGAFSSPESKLYREIQHSLFPDTAYGVESGGDPDVIPDLTYEDYLDFHRRYYHPSNSYIYLYGDMDIEEKLNWLDQEYLSHFDKISVDSEIHYQKELGVVESVCFYPISENEDTKNKTYLSYNLLLANAFDTKKNMAFGILDEVLLSAPGAPLKQALIEAGIGSDVLSIYNDGILQPSYSIIAKDAEYLRKEEFVLIINNVLTDLVATGLNKNSLKAAINKLEFQYREADYGRYPKGLMTGLLMFSSWLYDEKKAFSYLHANDIFRELKNEIDSGYFEQLIKEYMLDSKHATILTLRPEKGLTAKKEAELAKKLADYKESLSDDAIDRLIEDTKCLKEYQEKPATKEELLMIPLLTRSDIKKEAPELCVKEAEVHGIPALFHELFTNHIAYIKCIFDVSNVPADLLPYVGLLSNVFGYINTKKHSFLELANDINIHTGGITTNVSTLNRRNSPNAYLPIFVINAKTLYEEIPSAFEFIREMICDPIFDDSKRLLEIILEAKSRLEMGLNRNGHRAAASRAASYFSQCAYFDEMVGGIEYFKFISDLAANFETKKQEIITNLVKVNACIFAKENMLLSVTAEEAGILKVNDEIGILLDALLEQGTCNFIEAKKSGNTANWRSCEYHFPVEQKNEGFMFSGQVQYVAVAGNYIKEGFSPTGALKVLRTILSYDYLWNNIRVKGGAYGCSSSFSALDGTSFFTSYRDPNLLETKKVYEQAANFIESFDADEREMTKYIIGTMSEVDIPLNPMAKGSRSLNAFLSGVSYELIQKDRDEILNADVESIRATADLIRAVVEQDNLCVIGNENKLKDQKEMFKELKPLF